MDFCEEINQEEDIQQDIDGLKIVIDFISLDYLKNTVVDYLETLTDSGFKFANPAAKKKCRLWFKF